MCPVDLKLSLNVIYSMKEFALLGPPQKALPINQSYETLPAHIWITVYLWSPDPSLGLPCLSQLPLFLCLILLVLDATAPWEPRPAVLDKRIGSFDHSLILHSRIIFSEIGDTSELILSSRAGASRRVKDLRICSGPTPGWSDPILTLYPIGRMRTYKEVFRLLWLERAAPGRDRNILCSSIILWAFVPSLSRNKQEKTQCLTAIWLLKKKVDEVQIKRLGPYSVGTPNPPFG